MPAPTKLNKKTRETLLRARRSGASMADCAAAVRVRLQTLYNWLHRDENLALDMEEAGALRRVEVLERMQEASDRVNGRLLEAWLARTGRGYVHVDRAPATAEEFNREALADIFQAAGLIDKNEMQGD